MDSTAIASTQHHTELKAIDVDGNGAGKGLADDKIYIKSTSCGHLSIRSFLVTDSNTETSECLLHGGNKPWQSGIPHPWPSL